VVSVADTHVRIKMPLAMLNAFEAYCRANGTTMTEFVRAAIREKLEAKPCTKTNE
jgi:hypothetical protein